jgi:drug/metabolite transporter (DMT)-like permease
MNNNILAITLKVFSVLSFVIMDVLIKKLADSFPTNEIIFFRCLFGLVPVTFMMFWTKSSIKTSKINLHIYRALVASITMFAFFKSFHMLPLAEVSSISFASIMITTILAIFLLNEKVGIRRWVAIFIGFIGVIIILRPGSNIFNFYMLLPLFGATTLSVAIIIMKSVLKFDTPPTCSFYMHSLVGLIMVGTLFFNFNAPDYKQLFLLFCMGFVGGIAQILATNAYRLSDVSILSPIDYSSILWAITFGIIFFSDYPDLYIVIGSLVIVISTYYIIYRERKFGQIINLNKVNTRQI